MNVRNTVILVLLAIIGVVAAMWMERHHPSTGVAATIDTRPLLDADAVPVDRVNRVTLERQGKPEIVFVERDERWWQTTPLTHAMKSTEIEQLVQLATELTVVERLEADAGMEASLGLVPPAARLTLAWPEGTVRLVLGRRGIAGRSYLKRDDVAGVFVVNHELHERVLEQDPVSWRDPTLFAGVGIEADSIELMTGEETITLVRDRRTWGLEQPVATRANPAAIEALVQALARARASAFILDQPEDLSRFGLSSPAGIIAVTMTRVVETEAGVIRRETQTQRLLVGARVGVGTQDRYGMLEGGATVYRIPEGALKAFFLRPEQLAAATASGVDPADVKSIRVQLDDGDEFALERDVRRWIAPDHDGTVVDTERVAELLSILTGVQATGIEFARFPRDRSVATITMYGFDNRPLDTVRIARNPDGDTQWILENGDSVLRVFPANMALRLNASEYGLTPR